MGKNLKGKPLSKGVSQRENGKFQARFVTKSGKRVSKQFDKLKEAEKWLCDERYQDEHSKLASTEMTVDSWYEFWMENIKDWCISRQLLSGHRIRPGKIMKS